MTEKRFYKAYCCGDTGVVDKLENEWFIENINSISDIEKNWDTVIGRLNQVAEENEQLKKENKHLRCTIESNSQDDYIDYLEKQNERLKERIEELASNDKIVFMVNE